VVGVAEVGVVEHVVHISSDAEANTFRDLERFQHAEIAAEVIWSAEAIAACTAERSVFRELRGQQARRRLAVAAAVRYAGRELRIRRVPEREAVRIAKEVSSSAAVKYGEGVAGAGKESALGLAPRPRLMGRSPSRKRPDALNRRQWCRNINLRRELIISSPSLSSVAYFDL
jgi:hypothetical protein